MQFTDSRTGLMWAGALSSLILSRASSPQSDTIAAISLRHNMSIADICRWNNLMNMVQASSRDRILVPVTAEWKRRRRGRNLIAPESEMRDGSGAAAAAVEWDEHISRRVIVLYQRVEDFHQQHGQATRTEPGSEECVTRLEQSPM